MHRRFLILAGVLWAIAGASTGAALAQDSTGATEPEAATDLDVVAAGDTGNQKLGAALGAEVGGRVTPGGLRIGGSYIYRLNDEDWLDTSVNFTFGSGDANCFRDRENAVRCEHGVASGFAAEVLAAVRRDLLVQGQFRPFARVGVALRVIGFGGDDVIGLGVPLVGSGGVRARVHDKISVVAQIELRIGWGYYNRGLGIEPNASASIAGGVEFEID